METKAEYSHAGNSEPPLDMQAAQALEDMAARLRSGEVQLAGLTQTLDIDEVWYASAAGTASAFLRTVEILHLTVVPQPVDGRQLTLNLPDGPA